MEREWGGAEAEMKALQLASDAVLPPLLPTGQAWHHLRPSERGLGVCSSLRSCLAAVGEQVPPRGQLAGTGQHRGSLKMQSRPSSTTKMRLASVRAHV